METIYDNEKWGFLTLFLKNNDIKISKSFYKIILCLGNKSTD